jgi:hypothetical protein
VTLTGAAVLAMSPPAGSQGVATVKDTAAAAALGTRLADDCHDGEDCGDAEDCGDGHDCGDGQDCGDGGDCGDGEDCGDAEDCGDGESRTRLMRPFPIVRVKGTLLRGGARISVLRVRAPAGARVDVRCDGPRCPLRRRSFGSGRIGALERFLPTGTQVTIRVSEPDSIGKHVRLLIRDGKAPKRRDACLIPGSGEPVQCPLA